MSLLVPPLHSSSPPSSLFPCLPPPPRSTLFPYTTLFRSALRLIQHRRGDGLRWWATGDDFRGDWRDGGTDDHARQGSWPRVPLRGDDRDRRAADPLRYLQARAQDTVRAAGGDGRVRECARHYYLHGAVAAIRGGGLADVRSGRRRAGDHLSLSSPHHRGPLTTGRDRGPDSRITPEQWWA